MATRVENLVTIEPLTSACMRSLLLPREPPCLSLYAPTHRVVPANGVDLPAFLRLVARLDRALENSGAGRAGERLLRPFRLLATDSRFWRHTQDGLAVLAAGGRGRVFLLQQPVRPLAMVGDRFHTLPLIRAATALERFHALALTSRSARLWAGRIWHDPRGAGLERLDPVPLVAVPGGVPVEALERSDAVSAETFQPHRVQHGSGPAGRAPISTIHGGFGSRRDDADRDTEIFLRYVDEIVRTQASEPGELPLVLVAAARIGAGFRGLTKNPFLLAEHVDLDPHLLPVADLAPAIAPVFGRARAARIARELAAFGQARDHGLGSGDLAEIARAAVAGKVATLLVELDRIEPGRIDRTTGAVVFGGSDDGPDVLGSVAEEVLATGGNVLALARIAMPTETGVAAVYRYP